MCMLTTPNPVPPKPTCPQPWQHLKERHPFIPKTHSMSTITPGSWLVPFLVAAKINSVLAERGQKCILSFMDVTLKDKLERDLFGKCQYIFSKMKSYFLKLDRVSWAFSVSVNGVCYRKSQSQLFSMHIIFIWQVVLFVYVCIWVSPEKSGQWKKEFSNVNS